MAFERADGGMELTFGTDDWLWRQRIVEACGPVLFREHRPDNLPLEGGNAKRLDEGDAGPQFAAEDRRNGLKKPVVIEADDHCSAELQRLIPYRRPIWRRRR